MTYRLGAVLLAAIAAASLACSGSPVTTDAPSPAPAVPSASTAADEPVRIGPTADTEQVSFTLGLRVDDAAVARFLGAVNDPRSAEYRRFLSAAEFGARFGVGDNAIARIVEWATQAGLSATAVPQRTSISVRGTVAAVNRLLGVTLVDWETPEGDRFHRAEGSPTVPAGLQKAIADVIGLDTEPTVGPAFGHGPILAAGVPGGGLVPSTVARAYEIEQLHAAGILGQGQTIAILSLDALTPADVDRFDDKFDIDGPPVEIIKIPGALEEAGDETAEVALDVQVVRGIAPQAQILDYEGPKTGAGIGDLIARIVADGRADIVSVSWGGCEKFMNSGITSSVERELTAAAAAGISVFIASGDNGAFGCRRWPVSGDPFDRDISANAGWPASSPNVITVGGTFLSTRQDGSYLDEAGWEEPLTMTGGGGGLSTIYDRPSWQSGFGVDNAESNGMRQLPDVAAAADPTSGFAIEYTEPSLGGVTQATVGGTSAATPLWAAAMTLTRQLAESRGVDGLGALAPALYQIAGEQPPGAVFHDVIRGGNLLHEAGPGWDYATGLGTPRVTPLANAIVQFLTR
jgi:subtilase family serine protease